MIFCESALYSVCVNQDDIWRIVLFCFVFLPLSAPWGHRPLLPLYCPLFRPWPQPWPRPLAPAVDGWMSPTSQKGAGDTKGRRIMVISQNERLNSKTSYSLLLFIHLVFYFKHLKYMNLCIWVANSRERLQRLMRPKEKERLKQAPELKYVYVWRTLACRVAANTRTFRQTFPANETVSASYQFLSSYNNRGSTTQTLSVLAQWCNLV